MSTLNRRDRYTALPSGSRAAYEDFAHDQEDHLQKPEFPGKAIALSVSLLCCGITLLTLGLLHLRGHIFSKDGAGWGFTTLGLLTFLPGFYMSRIAYYTLRGTPGFEYSAIPNL